jgi:hypothetical protein
MQEILENDPQRIYRACRAASVTRTTDYYQVNAANLSGLLLERFPSLVPTLLEELTGWLERSHRQNNATLSAILNKQRLQNIALFDVVRAATERQPGAFADFSASKTIQAHLIRLVHEGESVWFRANAVTLLSLHSRISLDVAVALQNSMRDAVYVQEATLQALPRFRLLDGDILASLAQGLFHPDAATAYARERRAFF